MFDRFYITRLLNLVLTTQNLEIIDDILLGVDAMHDVNVEPDRAAAIAFAINQAVAGDLILVAGKGHEQFQIVGDLKLPFSDVDAVKQCLISNQDLSKNNAQNVHQDCQS